MAGMSAAAMAQGGNLTVDFGGGYQTLNYKMQDGVTRGDGKAGFTGQIGYQYYFTPNWGIGIGLSVRNFNASSVADYMQATPNAIDDDGESCEYRVYYNKLRESQKAMQVSFPVGLYYQKALAEKWTLVSGLGVRVDFATDNSYLTDAGNLDTRGWYERTKMELPNVPNHHYYTASDFSGSYKMNTSASAFLNIGAYYALFPDLEIGVLGYGSCGLSKLTDGSNSQLYYPDVQSYANPAYNGMLNSEATKSSRTVAIGGAVSLRIHFGKNGGKQQPKDDDFRPQYEDAKLKHQIDSLQNVADQLRKEQERKQNANDAEKRNLEKRIDALQQEIDRQRRELESNKKSESAGSASQTKPAPESIVNTKADKPGDVMGSFGFRGPSDSVINGNFSDNIDLLVEKMTKKPEMRIEIVGHTCNIGDEATNKEIGMKRAQAYKDELLKRGIDEARIEISTKWFTEPLLPNTSEANRMKNRRVEIKIID